MVPKVELIGGPLDGLTFVGAEARKILAEEGVRWYRINTVWYRPDPDGTGTDGRLRLLYLPAAPKELKGV